MSETASVRQDAGLHRPWKGTLEARVAELLRADEPVVLLTIVSSFGSAPRHAGTRALQTRHEFEGTVGGGILEAKAMKAAAQCLAEGRSVRSVFVLDASAPESDMVCGGRMEVLCEFLKPEQAGMFAVADASLMRGGRGLWVVDFGGEGLAVLGETVVRPVRRLYADSADAPLPVRVQEGMEEVLSLLEQAKGRPGIVEAKGRTVYVEPLDAPPVLLLCGGGHVSLEVARLAHVCGFVVDVVDDRPEFANRERFPMARHCHVLPGFVGLVEACGVGNRHFVVIMTRGHSFDREVLEQVLVSRARYVGMIGSKTKREHVYRALRNAGVPEAELAAVCCPIGLGIKAETPQQIAVSVVAELLAAQSGTLVPLRSVSA